MIITVINLQYINMEHILNTIVLILVQVILGINSIFNIAEQHAKLFSIDKKNGSHNMNKIQNYDSLFKSEEG